MGNCCQKHYSRQIPNIDHYVVKKVEHRVIQFMELSHQVEIIKVGHRVSGSNLYTWTYQISGVNHYQVDDAYWELNQYLKEIVI